MTQAVDVYALGGVIYYILTGQPPYSHLKEKWQLARSIAMHQMPIPPLEVIRNTTGVVSLEAYEAIASHPATQIMLKAIDMAWQYHATDRASASTIATLLDTTLQELSSWSDQHVNT